MVFTYKIYLSSETLLLDAFIISVHVHMSGTVKYLFEVDG